MEDILFDLPPETPMAERRAPRSSKLKALPNGEAPYQDRIKPAATSRVILNIDTLTDLLTRLKVTVRSNVISKEIEIMVPGKSFSPDNRFALSYAWIASEVKKAKMDTSYLDDFLLSVANEHQYNPVATWITSKAWDGHSRLKTLFDTIDADDNPAKEALLSRWLITGVAAAFEPDGITAAGMIVLQGRQGLGKTWWLRRLVPPELRNDVFKDSVSINPHDKDSKMAALRYWLVELGELDGIFTRSDVASLKAFITTDKDTMRMPYARKPVSLPRRTFMAGTVNNPYYLVDKTGNRRFWTIACRSIDSYHTIDMQQVWAELYELYKHGETWELTKKERDIVEDVNSQFEQLDNVVAKIQRFYNWKINPTEWRSPVEIAEEIGLRNPSHSDMTTLGITIMKLNGNQRKRTTYGRFLAVPPEAMVTKGITGDEYTEYERYDKI